MPVAPLLQHVVVEFADEARDLVEKSTACLLALEREDQSEAERRRCLEEIARHLHALKGSAATLGLSLEAQLAHEMEDLIGPFRLGGRAVPPEAIDALLSAFDAFLTGVRLAGDGQELDERAVSGVRTALAAAAAPAEAGPTTQRGALPDSAQRAEPMPDSGVAPESMAQGAYRVEVEGVAALVREVERVREMRLRLEARRRQIDATLERMRRGDGTTDVEGALAGLSRVLRSDGEEAADTVRALEGGLKSISTAPVQRILEPLQRATRDLCRQTGKRASLAVVGSGLALDRRLLEALRGPLVQLLRNAIVHGIEPEAERRRRGKHAEGVVSLRLEQVGNLVTIEFADDGAGLDVGRIGAVAQREGIRTADELAEMTTAEVHALIFAPGFSTRDTISETAGRGVGLDVVRAEVQKLGGQLEVHSREKQGTRFLLTLPVSLGSTPILEVRVGEQHIGLPMLAIERGLAYRPDDVRGTDERKRLRYGAESLPFVDLGVVLRVRPAHHLVRGQPIVVVQSGGGRVAVSVDEVIGEEELTVRPLPGDLRDLHAYQGIATLALGDLLLVLNPAFLVDQGRRADDVSIASSAPRVLAVDDSLTARAMYRTVLESSGYVVQAAATAEQAVAQLRDASFDVILLDLFLGESDGLTLIGTLRARAETRSTPVIVISAQGGDAERQRALAAGADSFLAKRDCASGRLLDEVKAVLGKRKGAR